MNKKLIRTMLLASASVLTLGGTAMPVAAQQQTNNQEQSVEKIQFNIPEQSLASALVALSHQSGETILANPDLTRDRTTDAVSGAYTTPEALSRLLESSGLRYQYRDDQSYLVTAMMRSDSLQAQAAKRNPPRSRELRLAQISEQERQSQVTSNDANDESDRPDEIVVTGTLIRGSQPVGAQLLVLDRLEIEKTGLSTTAEVIQTLPQTLGAGPNGDTTSVPGLVDAANNRGFGSSINLRGLGADSTLTLINGRRVAPGGANGDFIDVSLIPLTAVERVEVLPDGASALYGADALGGVVNVVLREDYEGLETRLRYGTVTAGDQQEFQIGQVIGTNWDSGGVLIAYEYFNQDSLFSEDRDFAASSDLTPFNGENFGQPFSNPGNISAGGQLFAIPTGQDGTNLQPSDLITGEVNLQNQRLGTTALPGQERHSVFATINQKLADRIELFSEFRYSDRSFESFASALGASLFVPSSNPFFVDPVGGSSTVVVQYNFFNELGPLESTGNVESINAVGGGAINLFNDWRFETYTSYSRENTVEELDNFIDFAAVAAALADTNPDTAFNPFGDGLNTNPVTAATLGTSARRDLVSELLSVNFKADGSLFELPGGEVKLAIGGEYRLEDLKSDLRFGTANLPTGLFDREIFAFFGEARIPIIGEANSLPWIKSLDISVAGRFEDYSDFGTTSNPKIGISLSPVDGFTFRGTYSTSFRAPLLTELDTSGNSAGVFETDDPAAPGGRSNIISLSGGNADLQPEDATSWSAGFDFAPDALPGLNLSVTYFDIDIEGRISRPTVFASVLANESQFGEIITRNPDPGTAQAILDDTNISVRNFIGATGADIDAIVDLRLNNLGVTEVNGLDITAAYSVDTPIGSLGFSSNSSIYFEFQEAITAASPKVDVLDTIFNQVDFRTRNSISWSNDAGLSATGYINYTDNHTDNVSDPTREIGSWTTVDFNVSYNTQERFSSDLLHGILLSVSVQNLFDEDPPFVNNPLGVAFDPTNSNPRGRFIAFQVVKQW